MVTGDLRLLARRSWRTGRVGWVLVTALTALVVAVSLSSFAAARRTYEAYPNVLEHHDAAHATIGMGNPDDGAALDDDDLGHLPGVAEAGALRFHLAGYVDHRGLFDPEAELTVVTPADDSIWRTVERPLVLDGTMPDPRDPDEVAVSTTTAERLGLGVGDSFRIGLISREEIESVMAGDLGVGARPEVRVSGIVRPTDFSGDPEAPFEVDAVLASAAFGDAHSSSSTFRLGYVRLADGDAGVPALSRALEARNAASDIGTRAATIDELQRASRPDVVSLVLFGVLTSVAGAIVIGQAIGRQLNADRQHERLFKALGMTRRRLAVGHLSAALGALIPGILVGGVAAAVASPLAPVGLVRTVTPHPGVDLDGAVHGAGPLAFLAVLVAVASGWAWRASAEPSTIRPRPTRMAAHGRWLPLPWSVAGSLASASRSTRRHVRSLATGLGVAVAILVVVAVFLSSSGHLAGTPELYGQRFDVAAWDGYGEIADEDIAAFLDDDPAVERFGGVAVIPGALAGTDTELFGFEDPTLGPTVLDGRLPTGSTEVLVGTGLGREVSIGDDVEVTSGDDVTSVEVVGIGVLPPSEETGGGSGVAFTLEGLRSFVLDAEVGWQYAALHDEDEIGPITDRFHAAFDSCVVDCDFVTPEPPTDVFHLARTRSLPLVAGAVVAIAAAVAALQAVLLLVRRNRFSMALLRALGCRRSVAARCVAAQAAFAAVAAVVVGGPLGLVAAGALWSRLAEDLGVARVVSVPLRDLAIVIVLAAFVSAAATMHLAARSARQPIGPTLARGDA